MERTPGSPGRLNGIRLIGVMSALGVALVFGGCTQERDQLRAEKQQVADENKKLTERLQSLKSESSEAKATLEDVQKGLEDIRARELKAIRSSLRMAQEGNPAGGRRDRLVAEIQTIREAVRQNLQKLAQLERANKESGVKAASLEMIAADLRKSLEDKEATIAALESKVGDLYKTVETQASSLAEKDASLSEKQARIEQTTKELHTAYVAVASKNVLKNKGVVQKQGSILGLGGRWVETGKFDSAVFRVVDVTKDLEVPIPAPASKVRIVTGQPKESYEIVDGGPNAESSRLAVKDPAAFWKGDRYLVVMIPD